MLRCRLHATRRLYVGLLLHILKVLRGNVAIHDEILSQISYEMRHRYILKIGTLLSLQVIRNAFIKVLKTDFLVLPEYLLISLHILILMQRSLCQKLLVLRQQILWPLNNSLYNQIPVLLAPRTRRHLLLRVPLRFFPTILAIPLLLIGIQIILRK